MINLQHWPPAVSENGRTDTPRSTAGCGRYTESVVARRVALVLVLVLGCLAGTDTFACPDGCRDDLSSSGHREAPAQTRCLVCAQAVPATSPIVVAIGSAERAGRFLEPRPVVSAGNPHRIDRPPRLA